MIYNIIIYRSKIFLFTSKVVTIFISFCNEILIKIVGDIKLLPDMANIAWVHEHSKWMTKPSPLWKWPVFLFAFVSLMHTTTAVSTGNVSAEIVHNSEYLGILVELCSSGIVMCSSFLVLASKKSLQGVLADSLAQKWCYSWQREKVEDEFQERLCCKEVK